LPLLHIIGSSQIIRPKANNKFLHIAFSITST
jgi:hypothetical protein